MQDTVFQLQRLVTAMSRYHNESHTSLKEADVFPIEVELSRSTFNYDNAEYNDENEEEEEEGEEAREVADDDDNLISTE